MAKIARIFVSLITALAAFAILFEVTPWVVNELARAAFEDPNDLSTGDTVGIVVLIAVPATIPLDAILSLAIGVAVYVFTSRRL